MTYKLLSVIFFFLFLPFLGLAATLYLEPAEGEYQSGDTFIVQVRIDVKDECVNAVEANLTFPQEALKAVDFSQGDSILSLWISSPSIDQELGLISFAGGIPAGYCGSLPGDPGESNLLGRIIFQAKETGQARPWEVGFQASSQTLLNDGLGTPAKLARQGAVFTILPGTAGTYRQEWQEELVKDVIPPEDFRIIIERNEAIFEGKYFITFSTVDKQTGVDRYELKEGRGEWQTAQSPYLLVDQSLKSIIKVKAADKAGNERVAEYRPPAEAHLYLIVIAVLILLGTAWLITRKIKK